MIFISTRIAAHFISLIRQKDAKGTDAYCLAWYRILTSYNSAPKIHKLLACFKDLSSYCTSRFTSNIII